MISIKIKLFGFILVVWLADVWAKQVVVHNPDGTTATFTTIQATIDACQPDGTVIVFTGTCTEATHINKTVALMGI